MTVAINVIPAIAPNQQHQIDVTGLAAGQVITFRRLIGSDRTNIAGQFIATIGGAVTYNDYLYPLDTPLVYEVWDSTRTTWIISSALVPAVNSLGFPWVRDTIYPNVRSAPLLIINIPDRHRAGRVGVFFPIGQSLPLTTGDVRSASSGTLTVFCRSHGERDRIVYALSSGNPCQLLVPAACTKCVDPMNFTPQGIDELPMGTNGACVLTIDFQESLVSDVATFAPITYAVQAANAVAVDLRYGTLTPVPSGLSLAFLNKTYRDMYYSQTGIAP